MASAPPTSAWVGGPPPPPPGPPGSSYFSAPLLPAVAGLGPPGYPSGGPPFLPPSRSFGGPPPPFMGPPPSTGLPPPSVGPPMPGPFSSSGPTAPWRVSYRVLEKDEYELDERGKAIVPGTEDKYRNWGVPSGPRVPNSPNKAQLVQQIQQKDAKIKELEHRAQHLRHKAHHFHDDWVKRVEHLEAHILHAKLHPVTVEEAVEQEREVPALNLVPNGLLREFEEKAVVDDNADDEEEEDDEETAQAEAENLARLSHALELPPLWEYPPDSKIVDIRLVEGPDSPEYEWMDIMPRRPRESERPREPPPTLQGRIYDSNWAFTPSPYHPVGVMAQNGLVNNLFPIDRAPINYENVFESTWPGADELWWTAYADYFTSRKFPGRYREVWPDRDCDRGKDIRNTMWSAEPPRRENIAAVPVDLNKDGFYDVMVVGRDRNNDGIPDEMQIPRLEKKVANGCAKFFGQGVS